VKRFLLSLMLDIVLTIILLFIWINITDEEKEFEYIFYSIFGFVFFLYIFFENIIVRKSQKETINVKYFIVRIIYFVIFLGAIIEMVSDLSNIKYVILFKGNIECMCINLIFKKIQKVQNDSQRG